MREPDPADCCGINGCPFDGDYDGEWCWGRIVPVSFSDGEWGHACEGHEPLCDGSGPWRPEPAERVVARAFAVFAALAALGPRPVVRPVFPRRRPPERRPPSLGRDRLY